MSAYRWTMHRKNMLRLLWPDYSASQIAKQLGGFDHCQDGGAHAVNNQAARMGLPTKSRAIRTVSHTTLVFQSERPLLAQPYRPGIDQKPAFLREKR